MAVINRDASDKYKGFRYQKLRLAKKILELIRTNPKTNIIAIPEHRDDSFLIRPDGKQEFEQNKEYSNNFSFNSIEVRKSVINFLDIYFELDRDPFLHFVFYTNVDYVKERRNNLLDEINLKPLNKPIIDYLIKQDYQDEVIEYVSKVIIESYRKEYKINVNDENNQNEAGYYFKISSMDKRDWIDFLKQVSFQFGQEDKDKLLGEVDSEIRESPYYSMDHVNREEQIRSYLLEKIDERMAEKHITQKIMNTEMVKNVFYEISNNDSNIMIDELHRYWNELEEELDIDNNYRNLSEKIEAVCSDINSKTLKRYNREATTVRDELKKYNQRQIHSLKFRVYESMERYFDDKFTYKDSYTFKELNSIVKDLKKSVVRDIETLRKDYNYGVRNNITVEKIVLLLIDECFYSFEGE